MADTGDSLLPLSMYGGMRDQYLGLFYPSNPIEVASKSHLHLHVLKISAGEFALDDLCGSLVSNSLAYVLPRGMLEELKKDTSLAMAYSEKVRAQFRPPDEKAGEGGEVILYSFLEGHLNAPQLLSKMALKTSTKHYVFGADGVHLLPAPDGRHQIIFGESKMYGDEKDKPGSSVKLAIKAAFKSMAEIKESGFAVDTGLVSRQLMQENVTEDQARIIEQILFPGSASADTHAPTKAFGVFIGFELDAIGVTFSDLDDEGIEDLLRRQAQELVEDQVELIKEQAEYYGLGGFHFHIYAIPFLKKTVKGEPRGLKEARQTMVRRLRGELSDS